MAFVPDAGLLRILALIDADLTHIAVSTDAPTETDTQLPTEFARKEVTLSFTDGLTVVKETYFDETEANGLIGGWGTFGVGATDSANTGTLIIAGPSDFTKTNIDSLTLSAEITIRRAST
jgi:hypothetical protein